MDLTRIIRIICLAAAIVAAFVAIPGIAIIFPLLGLALGFMTVPEDRRLNYLVATITLGMVAGSLNALPAVGTYLTAIFTNMSSILNAGAIAVILLITKDRLTE